MGSLTPLNNLVTRMGFILCLAMVTLTHHPSSVAELLAQPVNTVPAYPVQTEAETCRLELSDELFGGVKLACGGKSLDRSRCCPVLAAWLFSAHARMALQVTAPAPAPEPDDVAEEQPMMPDDSQKCVNSLQSSLQNRSINIVWPNSTCDPIMCFCGIRLHKVSSLSCPAAFNVTVKNHTAVPTKAVRNLEKSCRNSSYAGCTRCLEALGKLKAGRGSNENDSDRATKMFNRDCQLMGLTWLLARDKAAYIPTVSAVLRAIMYSAHPSHKSACSPDQENMPLAVDSLELESSDSPPAMRFMWVPVLPLIILGRLQRVWSCLAQSVSL